MAVAGDDDGNDIGVGRLGYIAARPRDVRCYPKSGQTRVRSGCPLSAKTGLMHRKQHPLGKCKQSFASTNLTKIHREAILQPV